MIFACFPAHYKPDVSFGVIKDDIWRRICSKKCFENVKLKNRSSPEIVREIRKEDLRFRGIRTVSNELYEFRKSLIFTHIQPGYVRLCFVFKLLSEHDEHTMLKEMKLFSFQLRLDFSIGEEKRARTNYDHMIKGLFLACKEFLTIVNGQTQ